MSNRQTVEAFVQILGLEAKLRLLIVAVLAGDVFSYAEFQHWLQYATPEMRERLLDHLN